MLSRSRILVDKLSVGKIWERKSRRYKHRQSHDSPHIAPNSKPSPWTFTLVTETFTARVFSTSCCKELPTCQTGRYLQWSKNCHQNQEQLTYQENLRLLQTCDFGRSRHCEGLYNGYSPQGDIQAGSDLRHWHTVEVMLCLLLSNEQYYNHVIVALHPLTDIVVALHSPTFARLS